MSKRKKKKKKKKQQKILPKMQSFPEKTSSFSPPSSDDEILLDTFPVESSSDDEEQSKPTSASGTGKASLENGKYMKTYPALIDKYILSRRYVPFMLVLIGFLFLFLTDNKAGNLANWGGILWMLIKSGILLCMYLSATFVMWLMNKLPGRGK